MLRPKFLVSAGFRRAMRNLRSGQTRNASRCEQICPTAEKKDDCPRPCHGHPNEVCPKPRHSINPFARGSGAGREIRKCVPKPVLHQTCKLPPMLHPQFSCGNSPPHAAEEFRQAYAAVREEALDTQIFARVASNNLIEPMIQRNRQRAAEETERLNLLLGNLKPKIDELLDLSLICGSREQARLYRMSDKLHAQLQIWNCENASGENCVKCRLQQLEWTVKERTDTAVEIVRTCNRSVTPNSLLLCVSLTTKDAKCILARTNETIKKEIADIEELKLQFFLEGDRILVDLKKKMESEINDFSCHLTFCIRTLKKLSRRNKMN